MPTWAKVLLIIGALMLLLIVGVVGTGVYLWREHGPQFIAGTEKVMKEGNEYGAHTDNQGCLTEGVARHQKADGFSDLIQTNLFLRTCLEASRPTSGFCDDVPKQMEIMKAVGWQALQCKRYGMTQQKQCGQFFQQVQQFCERRPTSTPEDNSATP